MRNPAFVARTRTTTRPFLFETRTTRIPAPRITERAPATGFPTAVTTIRMVARRPAWTERGRTLKEMQTAPVTSGFRVGGLGLPTTVVTAVAELSGGVASGSAPTAVAVFSSLPVCIGLTRSTIVTTPPAGIVPSEQDAMGVVAQLPCEGAAERKTSEPGRGSVSWTSVAGSGPLFETVIVYTSVPPTRNGSGASAFVTTRSMSRACSAGGATVSGGGGSVGGGDGCSVEEEVDAWTEEAEEAGARAARGAHGRAATRAKAVARHRTGRPGVHLWQTPAPRARRRRPWRA